MGSTGRRTSRVGRDPWAPRPRPTTREDDQRTTARAPRARALTTDDRATDPSAALPSYLKLLLPCTSLKLQTWTCAQVQLS